jgi:hypothetical protein
MRHFEFLRFKGRHRRQTVKVASGCCNFRVNRAPCFNRRKPKELDHVLEKGISWEVIWFDFDQNLIEIVFTCSNGHFCGTCEMYVSRDELSERFTRFSI